VTGLELSNLNKFYPVSALLTGIVFVCALFIAPTGVAYGTLIGGVFGITNTWLIVRLTESVLDSEKRNPVVAATILVLKLPVVYGFLILSFLLGWNNPLGFAVGFQLFFITLFIWVISTHLLTRRMRASRGDDAR
jgi:hypothetical protein